MAKTNKRMLTMKSQEIVLGVLFVIYFILGYPIPEPVADIISTTGGKVVVFAVALMLFLVVNPIVAVIGLLVAFDIIMNAQKASGKYAMDNYSPSEKQKAADLNKYNQFSYTLEQEMVAIRTLKQPGPAGPASFKPVLENDHDASPVTQM